MLLQQRNLATMIPYLLLLLDAFYDTGFQSQESHLHVFTAGTFTASMYPPPPLLLPIRRPPLTYLLLKIEPVPGVLIFRSSFQYHSCLRVPPTYTERAL